MRYVYKNINLLNLLLLTFLIVLVLLIVLPLFHLDARYVVPSAPKTAIPEEEVSVGKDQPAPLHDYVVIGENNLFHPQRMIPPEKKDLKAQPKPEIVLYGTVVGDDITIAYVEDKKSPKTSPGRGKRQSVIKKGDIMAGFSVTEIKTDRIVLTRGEETMVVPLMETGKQRGDESKPGSARPSFVPGGSSASASTGANAMKPAASPGVPASALLPPAAASAGTVPPASSSHAGSTSAALPPAAAPSPAAPAAAPTLQQLQQQRYRSNTARGNVRPTPLNTP